MKKRFLAIVSVFALVLAMMPGMAFAETGVAEDSISTVSLNVTPPMDEQNTAYTTPDVAVPDGADYSISGSGWRNNAAGDPLPYSIYFTAGRAYYFALELTAKDGFTFSPDAALNVSGGSLESKDVSGTKATMIISVVASAKPFTPIESVSVTINVPTAGMTVRQAYDANTEQTLIPSGQHYRAPANPLDGTYISWQYPSGSYMRDTYEFIEGSEYIAGVYLVSEGDYDFTEDTKLNVSGGTVISHSIGTHMTQTTLSITVKVKIGDATHNTVSFDVNSGSKGQGWPSGDAMTLDKETKLNFSISGVNSDSAEISVSGGTEAKVNATAPSGYVFYGISIMTQTETNNYSAGDTIPEYTLSQPLMIRLNWVKKPAIDKISLTLKSPVCGTVITGNPKDKESIPEVKIAGDNCQLYQQPAWVSSEAVNQPFTGKIVGGENYKAKIMVAANDAFTIDPGNPPEVSVNGKSVAAAEITKNYITVIADAVADHGNAKSREEITKAAACTESGTKDYIVYCPECNKELARETDTIAATGHLWGEWKVVKEATETAAGLKTRTCSSCGAEDSSSIPAKGAASHVHVWDSGVVVCAPGCETAGETRYTCSVCGETRTEHPEQTGHAAGEWTETVVRQNTCGHKGYVIRTLHCKNCGEVLTRNLIPVDAVDHVWNSGKVTKTPSSKAKGSITYTCTICGETKTESLSMSKYNALKKKYKPGKVSLIRVKKSGKKVTAKWKKTAKADGYQLQIRKGKKTVKTINVSGKGKTISRTVGKLKKKAKYTVHVRAYNNKIGVRIYGKWSKVKKAKAK